MTTSNLTSLIKKLNPQTHQSLEKAAGLCLSRGHFNVELAHWLLCLIESGQTTFALLLKQSTCNIDKFNEDLNQSLQQLPTGNDQTPAISARIIDLINEAWLIASLEYAQANIHSGFLLCAILQNTLLRQICCGISAQFNKLNLDIIKNSLGIVLASSNESTETETKSELQKPSKTCHKALGQYTINLNQQAKDGKLDAAIGREDEIRQVMDILSRRRQNNAMLTGEPGVGKTALVEGLALSIVKGDVPEKLQNVIIHSLDMGLLQAGAGIKGEFENRLKRLIQEIKQAPTPIILFIDEAHTLIGAGNQAGGCDGANLLKPALARGELRSIAATTWSEYKQYVEKDAALTRRFQVVQVNEPDTNTTLCMLRSLSASMEKHHQVQILDDALMAATKLSQRYISGRQLPDKAISVLDTACARVASKQNTTPALIEKHQKQLQHLQLESKALQKETKQGINHRHRLRNLEAQIKKEQRHIKILTKRWLKEKDLVSKMLTTKNKLADEKLTKSKQQTLKKTISKCQTQLKKSATELPMIQAYVDANAIAEVIAHWTGIPVGKMLKDDVNQILQLDKVLQKRIVGQDHALALIAKNIQASSAKLTDPHKPLGIFLFVGPSGVGKTETALALAETLYGHNNKLTVINMSEFKEEHKISMLLGSPPGYVGYGEGGVLTEAVRRKPYSLILLDEIEKAHPGVQDIFYQLFDKGIIKDGQGRDIDFKNTLIILTSNACGELISKGCCYSDIEKALQKIFKPAFLGRLTVVPYYPLEEKVLKDIVLLKLAHLQERLLEQHHMELNYDNKVIQWILQRCQHHSMGARQIDNIITTELMPTLSEVVLQMIMDEQKKKTILISCDKEVLICQIR